MVRVSAAQVYGRGNLVPTILYAPGDVIDPKVQTFLHLAHEDRLVNLYVSATYDVGDEQIGKGNLNHRPIGGQ